MGSLRGVNFYNEHDPKAAAWLRELIRHEHIPAGIVDERTIEDICPSELAGFTQCHFFAGIGGWSLALKLAGWPDDRPVWTGSCPCQPFSTAGKGGGFADERHLWPAFHHLISQCQPPVVFGEQVASKDGLAWLDLVRADCEASGYAVGAVDLCAASVGAPHIRQRLWWVADRNDKGLEGRGGVLERAVECVAWPLGVAGRLAHSTSREEHQEQRGPAEVEGGRSADVSGGCGVVDGLADTNRQTCSGRGVQGSRESVGASSGATCERSAGLCEDSRPSPLHGFWRDADWLLCRDGKWRPVKSAVLGMVDGIPRVVVPNGGIMPASFPLAQNQERRVMRLRGYGNAIVPQVAAQFIQAYLETLT